MPPFKSKNLIILKVDCFEYTVIRIKSFPVVFPLVSLILVC